MTLYDFVSTWIAMTGKPCPVETILSHGLLRIEDDLESIAPGPLGTAGWDVNLFITWRDCYIHLYAP